MKVEVTDVDTKEVTIYSSITAAATQVSFKVVNIIRYNNFTDNNRNI